MKQRCKQAALKAWWNMPSVWSWRQSVNVGCNDACGVTADGGSTMSTNYTAP